MGEVWRVVESQHVASTMRLTDSLDEQDLLEQLIDEVKPEMPPACRGLHYLLATPFRYAPYRHGSRFRRAGQREGAYYAAEAVTTALAETAFYRLLFLAESPGMPLPERPYEHTAFSIGVETSAAIDLTRDPFSEKSNVWAHPIDYGPCQDLADAARQAQIGLIRYRSVRDPNGGANVAVLTPISFANSAPTGTQSWKVFVGERSVRLWCSGGAATVDAFEIDRSVLESDPRLTGD